MLSCNLITFLIVFLSDAHLNCFSKNLFHLAGKVARVSSEVLRLIIRAVKIDLGKIFLGFHLWEHCHKRAVIDL